MIKSFKTPALARFYRDGDASGINPDHRSKVRAQLLALSVARAPPHIHGPPGWRLEHYRDSEVWSIRISGPWRLRFKHDGTGFTEVEYVQSH